MGAVNIDLTGLEGKWTRQSLDHPPCAACGLRIGGEDPAEDEGPDGQETPLRLFRGDGDAMQELALHWRCAERRMYRERPERN